MANRCVTNLPRSRSVALHQIEVEAANEEDARARAQAKILAAGDPSAVLISIRDTQHLGTVVEGDRRLRVSLWRGYVRDDSPSS